MRTITSAVAAAFIAVTSAAAAQVSVSSELGDYFTRAEIAEYERSIQGIEYQPVGSRVICNGDICSLQQALTENRLKEEGHNRCGDNVLPPDECPEALAAAWDNGNGCINATEYNYALENAIAPLCKPYAPDEFVGWCRCGCFEKSTVIFGRSIFTGYDVDLPVSEVETELHQVYALTANATLSEPELSARDLTATTVGREDLPLVWVNLKNGVKLGLTTEHAVLLGTGQMVPADSLEAGDEMVSAEGQLVEIAYIERKPTSDPVYNVLTDAGLSHAGHMIVANGMLVGDIMWQNTLSADLWDIVLRM